VKQSAAVKTEPVTAHGRPVKSASARIVAQVEVDGGDHVIVHLTMSAEELLARADRIDQPDMWPVVEARLKREVVRRES
jgi:hypothetical protein